MFLSSYGSGLFQSTNVGGTYLTENGSRHAAKSEADSLGTLQLTGKRIYVLVALVLLIVVCTAFGIT